MKHNYYGIWDISIHALHEEGDLGSNRKQPKQRRFLSTPSMRRATGEI